MSKENLRSALRELQTSGAYNWSLYFINLGRAKQRYTAHNVKFKNATYLSGYVEKLLPCIEKYSIDPVVDVEEYNAINTKVSCDKINVDDEKITERWKQFKTSVAHPSDEALSGNCHFYVLQAAPTQDQDNRSSVALIKFANPIVRLETKKSIVFKRADNDEFEEFADDVLRLYLTVDCIYMQDTLYCFTHAFEKPFGLNETIKTAKNAAIEKIAGKDIFADAAKFMDVIQSTNARTLLALNEDRLQNLVEVTKRTDYAQQEGFALDGDNKIILSTDEQTKAMAVVKNNLPKLVLYDPRQFHTIPGWKK